MGNDYKPVTKEEAMKYDVNALQGEVERRRRNIKLFQDQISAEEREIERIWQILGIINAAK